MRRRWLWLAILGTAAFVAWERASAFAVATFVGPPVLRRGPIAPPRDVREVIEVERAGATIKAWLLDPPAGTPLRGTIAVLHGIRDSKARSLGSARAHARRGYRVLVWDSRGHGESTGAYLTYGVEEARDLVAMIDVLSRKELLARPLYVVGTSYGGATVLQYGALDARVDKIAAIAPFASLREVVRSYLRWWFGGAAAWIPESVIDARIDHAAAIAGFDADRACPRCVAAQLRAAVLIVASRDDERIPYTQSVAIAEAIGQRARVKLVDGAGHVAVGRAPGVAEAVAGFFDAPLEAR